MPRAIAELDTVVLIAGHGQWLPGTIGTVVARLDAQHVLLELAGPEGATLELLPVADADLTVVPQSGRLAG